MQIVAAPSGAMTETNRLNTSNLFLKLHVFEHEDSSVVIDSGDFALDRFTKSLVMLHQPLSDALHQLCMQYLQGVDSAQVTHLQYVFDQICASSLTASADAICDQYATRSMSTRHAHSTVIQKSWGGR